MPLLCSALPCCAMPLRCPAQLCRCSVLLRVAFAMPRLALLMLLHMRNGVEHKEHDFCAQCGKHARHKRVNIHRCSPPLCVLSQRVIMAEKGGVDMMHLGSELRRVNQEAELEFRDSMQDQLEETNRKLQTQIDDARTEAKAASREAMIARALAIASLIVSVIALFK
nr:MAG TPA: hypothetical protein [Caudoviricetes sp.]